MAKCSREVQAALLGAQGVSATATVACPGMRRGRALCSHGWGREVEGGCDDQRVDSSRGGCDERRVDRRVDSGQGGCNEQREDKRVNKRVDSGKGLR